MAPGRSLVAIALLLSGGCTIREMATTEQQAIQVANAGLLKTWPKMKLDHFKVDAIDMGDVWRLQYDQKDPGTGGPIIVVVNKRRAEVVHIETEQ